MACEGRGDEKKRTLSDRRVQGNGEINFHGSQFLLFFFPFYLRHVRASYVEFDLIVGENLEMT